MKYIKRSLAFLFIACMMLSVFSSDAYAAGKPVDVRAYRKGRNMVSMGDSFASGESIGHYGTGDVFDEHYDIDEDFLAHRSAYSWSGMLKLPGTKGRMRDNRGSTWQFVACSGATTDNLKGKQTKEYNHLGNWGYNSGSHDLAPQFDVFSKGRIDPKEVDYVTLSIGGNDVDFKGIIQAAAINGPGYYGYAADAVADKQEHFDDPGGTRDKLMETYRRIASEAPNATIIITGYPPLLDPKCEDANLFNENEAKVINDGVHWFNGRIKKMIDELKRDGIKIEFADVETKFKGHEAYSSDPWINGLVFGAAEEELDIDEYVSMNSIHPNFQGAKAYAECVQEVIDRVEREKAEMRKKIGIVDEDISLTGTWSVEGEGGYSSGLLDSIVNLMEENTEGLDPNDLLDLSGYGDLYRGTQNTSFSGGRMTIQETGEDNVYDVNIKFGNEMPLQAYRGTYDTSSDVMTLKQKDTMYTDSDGSIFDLEALGLTATLTFTFSVETDPSTGEVKQIYNGTGGQSSTIVSTSVDYWGEKLSDSIETLE